MKYIIVALPNAWRPLARTLEIQARAGWHFVAFLPPVPGEPLAGLFRGTVKTPKLAGKASAKKRAVA